MKTACSIASILQQVRTSGHLPQRLMSAQRRCLLMTGFSLAVMTTSSMHLTQRATNCGITNPLTNSGQARSTGIRASLPVESTDGFTAGTLQTGKSSGSLKQVGLSTLPHAFIKILSTVDLMTRTFTLSMLIPVVSSGNSPP